MGNLRLNKTKILTGAATLGFVGHLPKAPGTWGSFVAMLAAPWLFIPYSLSTKLTILFVLFFVGSWACSAAEKTFGKKDPSQAIIDEVLGQWITFLFITTAAILPLLLGFILFRVFDITKPFPVRQSEKWLPGGYSVMLDDLIAGLYALAALSLILYLIPA
ncbi:phosphatidylglycerophosphatase A family protein [Desulfonatronovibrio magnus]|uniref:phosphatidylglycerophosphatase A family protein n=1 Tax=Desulfonatronovibrio magnus TaxID=698827 RepID=UPI0005EB95B2|nr:phosphatidylglycerophosphatase A [Desulfonatronovibrio magnus]